MLKRQSGIKEMLIEFFKPFFDRNGRCALFLFVFDVDPILCKNMKNDVFNKKTNRKYQQKDWDYYLRNNHINHHSLYFK